MELKDSNNPVSDDEEDLEQLRLAALQSLKRPVAPNSANIHLKLKKSSLNLNRRGRGFQGRNSRNGQFNNRTRNSNLIPIPTVQTDTPDVDILSSKKFKYNDNATVPRLVLPQDRYCNTKVSEEKPSEPVSKFDRYNNSDKSESESEYETGTDSKCESPPKLERANSLEALMQELENEIHGDSKAKDEKCTKVKNKVKKRKRKPSITVDDVATQSDISAAVMRDDSKVEVDPKIIEIDSKLGSKVDKVSETPQLQLKSLQKDSELIINKPKSRSPPSRKTSPLHFNNHKNYHHERLVHGISFVSQNLPYERSVIFQPFNNQPLHFNPALPFSPHTSIPPPPLDLQRNFLPIFSERSLSPLTLNTDDALTIARAPLSPRSAAFVLQNREIVERRKKSPRRSYSRSPSPRYRRSNSPRSYDRSPSPLRPKSPRKFIKTSRSPTPNRGRFSPSREKLSSPFKEKKVSLAAERPVEIREKRLSPIREKRISPLREKRLSPVREKRLSPSREKRLSPIREKRLSPNREKRLSPNREKRLSPNRDRRLSPNRERRLSPSRDKRLSPIRDKRMSPVREKRLSPVREKRLSPIRDKRSPIRERRLSPVRDRRSSPVRDRRSSPIREKRLSPTREKKSPGRDRSPFRRFSERQSPVSRKTSPSDKSPKQNYRTPPRVSIRDRLGNKALLNQSPSAKSNSSPQHNDQKSRKRSRSLSLSLSPERPPKEAEEAEKPLDPVLEARRRKFETNEIKTKEGIIRLKPKIDDKEEVAQKEPEKEEEDMDVLNADELLEGDGDVLDTKVDDLFSDEETDEENEGRFKSHAQLSKRNVSIVPFTQLLNDPARNVKNEVLTRDRRDRINRDRWRNATRERRRIRSQSPRVKDDKNVKPRQKTDDMKRESLDKKDAKDKLFLKNRILYRSETKREKVPVTAPIENKKIEIKIRNPSKYETTSKYDVANEHEIEKLEKAVRKVEVAVEAKKEESDQDENEPEIIIDNEEDSEDLSQKSEGDLRAQLSRKRAERQNKLPLPEDVQSRLLQNALQGAVFKKTKKSKKEKESAPKDGKLPIHLRLGFANTMDTFTETVTHKKKKKSKNRGGPEQD